MTAVVHDSYFEADSQMELDFHCLARTTDHGAGPMNRRFPLAFGMSLDPPELTGKATAFQNRIHQ